jgi:hypothetical protein
MNAAAAANTGWQRPQAKGSETAGPQGPPSPKASLATKTMMTTIMAANPTSGLPLALDGQYASYSRIESSALPKHETSVQTEPTMSVLAAGLSGLRIAAAGRHNEYSLNNEGIPTWTSTFLKSSPR